jgi:hypothetical protein
MGTDTEIGYLEYELEQSTTKLEQSTTEVEMLKLQAQEDMAQTISKETLQSQNEFIIQQLKDDIERKTKIIQVQEKKISVLEKTMQDKNKKIGDLANIIQQQKNENRKCCLSEKTHHPMANRYAWLTAHTVFQQNGGYDMVNLIVIFESLERSFKKYSNVAQLNTDIANQFKHDCKILKCKKNCVETRMESAYTQSEDFRKFAKKFCADVEHDEAIDEPNAWIYVGLFSFRLDGSTLVVAAPKHKIEKHLY